MHLATLMHSRHVTSCIIMLFVLLEFQGGEICQGGAKFCQGGAAAPLCPP